MLKEIFFERTSRTILCYYQEPDILNDINSSPVVISLDEPAPLGAHHDVRVQAISITIDAKLFDEVVLAWAETRGLKL